MSEQAEDPKGEGKPRGKSLRWTAEDIAALSKVGPEDMLGAKAAFKRFATKKFKTLLDAKKQPPQK